MTEAANRSQTYRLHPLGCMPVHLAMDVVRGGRRVVVRGMKRGTQAHIQKSHECFRNITVSSLRTVWTVLI